MRTVRINVTDPFATLDGVTLIDFSAPGVTVAEDPTTGIEVITLPIGAGFGAFLPGEFLDGPPSQYWLKHMSVSRGDGNAFSPGSYFGIRGPEDGVVIPAGTGLPMPWLEFVAQADTDTGLLPEGVCSIIPTDHALVFQSGVDIGPFAIQFSLETLPRINQTCQRPIIEPTFTLIPD